MTTSQQWREIVARWNQPGTRRPEFPLSLTAWRSQMKLDAYVQEIPYGSQNVAILQSRIFEAKATANAYRTVAAALRHPTPTMCLGCGRTFATVRGMRAHQSNFYTKTTCKHIIGQTKTPGGAACTDS